MRRMSRKAIPTLGWRAKGGKASKLGYSGNLPVENRNVSPSGDRYILTNDSSLPDAGGFYLVDVKTGARRLVLRDGPPQAPGSWTVVEFADAGVYLWSAGMQTVPGLWLLDPAGSRPLERAPMR